MIQEIFPLIYFCRNWVSQMSAPSSNFYEINCMGVPLKGRILSDSLTLGSISLEYKFKAINEHTPF